MVGIVTALEGHPDNASAGVLGGFTVSRFDPVSGAFVDTIKVAVPEELTFVVVSPELELLTKESRGALPATLPYFDAIRSLNSAAYLAAAFTSGEYEKLRHAVADYTHEPYRLPKIPGGREAIEAGEAAGALTGWLSGSGSSVLCISREDCAERVATAMQAAFQKRSVACTARVLFADNDGLRVE